MTRTTAVHRLLFIIVMTGLFCGASVMAAAPPAAQQQPTAETKWFAPDQEAAKKRAGEVVPFV